MSRADFVLSVGLSAPGAAAPLHRLRPEICHLGPSAWAQLAPLCIACSAAGML